MSIPVRIKNPLFTLALTFFLSCYPLVFPRELSAQEAVADSESIEGTVEVTIVDYFDRPALELIQLVRPNKEKLRLELKGSKKQLKTGDRVFIRQGRTLGANSIEVEENDLTVTEEAAVQVIGTRSLAVIRVSSADITIRCNRGTLENLYWTGTKNVRGMFQASSYGALSFTNDLNNDGAYDVFEVTLPYATNWSCNYLPPAEELERYSNDAKAILLTQGINLNNWNLQVFIVPADCPFAGRGSVGTGSGISWIPDEYCNYLDIVSHEIGHNLGLRHASLDPDNNGATNGTSDEDYGDVSCIMGYGGYGTRYFNAVHAEQQQWLPSGRVVSESGTMTVTLAPLELDPQATSFPYLLKATRPSGGQYFVSYREVIGPYSSNLPTPYRQRVIIHHNANPNDGSSSYQVKVLNVGESWSNTAAGITVGFVSRGTNAATVSFNGPGETVPKISSSVPPDFFIDPLEHEDPLSQLPSGRTDVQFFFNTPVRDKDGGVLTDDNFTIRYFRNGSFVSAAVADLSPPGSGYTTDFYVLPATGEGPYIVRFTPRLPLGVWTDIQVVDVVSTGGVQLSSTGRDARRTIGYLPMDVNQDGFTRGNDLHRWFEIHNGSWPVPTELNNFFFINQRRNATIAGDDITRAIQLLNEIQNSWSITNIGTPPP